MPPLTMQEEGRTKGTSCPSHCPMQAPFKPLPQVLGKQCRSHLVEVSRMGGCPRMCPWVGSHAPSCERQLWGLPSRVEYLSPQGVLLSRVYGTIASPLWLELRGPAAWQRTPPGLCAGTPVIGCCRGFR